MRIVDLKVTLNVDANTDDEINHIIEEVDYIFKHKDIHETEIVDVDYRHDLAGEELQHAGVNKGARMTSLKRYRCFCTAFHDSTSEDFEVVVEAYSAEEAELACEMEHFRGEHTSVNDVEELL